MTEYEVAPPPTRLVEGVQIRLGFTSERGDVARFVTQLKYWLDGDWRAVVRYDHDQEVVGGHNVEVEGLHRDVYRDGEKVRTETETGPIPADAGFDCAEVCG